MSLQGPSLSHANLEEPVGALGRLCERIKPVEIETVDTLSAAGRVLGQAIVLDRPSPACDVSAMDGFAVRAADVAASRRLPVSAEVAAGSMAAPLAAGTAVRIFTGAMVPPGADVVIPRELVIEEPGQVSIPRGLILKIGQCIRRAGENGMAGRALAAAGSVLTPPILAAAAACGLAKLRLYRPVRVAIIVTGGEVLGVASTPQPWQLRDSNGPALCGLLAPSCWIDVVPVVHVQDDPGAIAAAVTAARADCDALLITGGVSAGDYDFVPAVLRDLGLTRVFHKLAIRPGKPVLGAVDDVGRPVLALPGNPVSVMVTARRLGAAVLRCRGGFADIHGPAEIVEVDAAGSAPADLTWFPLVSTPEAGCASLIPGKGSGDWVSAAASDGFIEVPPGQGTRGLKRLYRWTLT